MVKRSYDRISSIPLTVSGYELVPLRETVSSGFTRVSTAVRLQGPEGEVGVGEDVTYEAADHQKLWESDERLAVNGRWDIEGFSRHLESLQLFPDDPVQYASRQYRRWAFESAALDLALRQLGAPLHAILDREMHPMRFVVSMRLPSPPTIEPIDALLQKNPNLRFKLDPTSEWSGRLCQALAALRRVDIIDLKGAYKGTPVDQAPDPELYERLLAIFEDCWLEDPHLDDHIRPLLDGHESRITWDAPIHSVADIAALPFMPRMLNSKPSRFGSTRELFDAYDYCARAGIRLYGGGQFELGPGRGQAQYLASMFHPNAPNDLAPSAYNRDQPGLELSPSPLLPQPDSLGFRWD